MTISNLDLPVQTLGFSLGNADQLAGELALTVSNALRGAIAERGAATLVVSGGRSPIAFFERLAQQELDWAKVTISLADERWVPVSHPDSNEGLLRRHLRQGPAAAARLVGLYQSAASLEQATPPRCFPTARTWKRRSTRVVRGAACRCRRRASRASV